MPARASRFAISSAVRSSRGTPVVSVAVTWRSGKWLPAVLGLIGTAGIGLLILSAKLVVGRSRPALPYAIVSEDGYSFPSGHATGTAAVGLLSRNVVVRGQLAGAADTYGAHIVIGDVDFGTSTMIATGPVAMIGGGSDTTTLQVILTEIGG